MSNLDIHKSLGLLNHYLQKIDEHRSFVICGGASIILRGIEGRGTSDIDIIGPAMDDALTKASLQVASDLGLHNDWLNDKPRKFYAEDLPEGWESRVFVGYSAAHLVVQSVSDFDLAVLKFIAECDRNKDIQDIVDLNLSKQDIARVVAHVLSRDPGDVKDWNKIVAKVELRLRKKMGYEKN
jgi:hypothetical protein